MGSNSVTFHPTQVNTSRGPALTLANRPVLESRFTLAGFKGQGDTGEGGKDGERERRGEMIPLQALPGSASVHI